MLQSLYALRLTAASLCHNCSLRILADPLRVEEPGPVKIPTMSLPELKTAYPRVLEWRSRLFLYTRLVRLDRPIGIFLLMWPALWALWIAGEGSPPWHVVLIFVGGVVLMRSAGCAINDFADRNLDGHVARTRGRPIASRLVSPREAIGVFLVLSLAAFLLVLFLSWQTVALSVVALSLAVVYPFMKRYTHVPQLFLGAAFGWAVPMAFTAIAGSVPPMAWLLFCATVIWALVYDTQYAMVDREDDLAVGIKSTAILFGSCDRLMVGLLQVLMLSILAVVGYLAERGTWYVVGLVVAGLLAAYHQYLIRERDPDACFQAFLGNNYLGMAVFLGLIADFAFG
jgi:4-hydroxybenzoate polyprenyltransferase